VIRIKKFMFAVLKFFVSGIGPRPLPTATDVKDRLEGSPSWLRQGLDLDLLRILHFWDRVECSRVGYGIQGLPRRRLLPEGRWR
jgi:hypothetical protein